MRDTRDLINGDVVDRVIAEWRGAFPDIDPSAKEVVGRIVRANALVHSRYLDLFNELGIKETSFRLLAALRRSGPPFQLNPSDLTRRYLNLTSGGTTGVINRLEKQGLVERVRQGDDRRTILVRLTPAGKKTIDKVMRAYSETERSFVDGMSDDERTELMRLLRKLVGQLERHPSASQE